MRSLEALAIVASALLVLACVAPPPGHIIVRTQTGEVLFNVEVARTPEEQMRGLMNRTSLPTQGGMLFVFEPARPVAFWMKETLIPLDMVFAAPNGSIERIVTATPCAADPCLRYPSGGPVKYVLEIPGGTAASQGIAVGDRLVLTDANP